MSEQVYAYVGIKACGCAVAATVDKPEFRKDNAKATAKWIRDGLTIERWTVERVRTDFTVCPHETKQRRLKAEGR